MTVKEYRCPHCGKLLYYRKVLNADEFVVWHVPKTSEDDPSSADFYLPLFKENYLSFMELLQNQVRKWLRL